jgi:hypothetical protein
VIDGQGADLYTSPPSAHVYHVSIGRAHLRCLVREWAGADLTARPVAPSVYAGGMISEGT